MVAFRTLRPPCVDLSQIALKYKAKKASSQEVIKALETVSSTLQQIVEESDVLDPKLADYVFFPLSHIFRDFKDLPARAVEVALQCLHILISQGWKSKMAPEIGKQLLILLSFIAGGTPQEAKVKSSHEETTVAAFNCLSSLFSASDAAGLSDEAGLIPTENVPVLGHTVTVLLDGLSEGNNTVRIPVLNALKYMILGVHDREALRKVFPGTVSAITKLISSRGGERPSSEVLVDGLETLEAILVRAIADEQRNGHDIEANGAKSASLEAESAGSWVQATAPQVKMALANVMPLRYHEKQSVRSALLQLCIALIQNCRKSLDQTMSMVVETAVIICPHSPSKLLTASFAADASLLEILKESLYDWINSMPRTLQSNDDTRKERMMDKISGAFRLLESQGESSLILYDVMTTNLHASIAAVIHANQSQKIASASEGTLEVSHMLKSTGANPLSLQFEQFLFHHSLSSASMKGLEGLTHQLQSSQIYSKIQQDIEAIMHTAAEEDQLAYLWLCLQLISSGSQDHDDDVTNQYLNLPVVAEDQEPLLDDIYKFALDTISVSTFEDSDRWRLQCLCLEVIALQARHQGIDFRPELIDTLYPILERLGSPNSVVQSHALTCFSIITKSCQYSSPAALIIGNADYLVNAISHNLSSVSPSPQVLQVLIMTTTLCGPALIPNLDDIISRLFSILHYYHGYPKLVEAIFSALNAIVAQASAASAKTIDYRPDGITKPDYPPPPTISDLTTLLHTNANPPTQDQENESSNPFLPPPTTTPCPQDPPPQPNPQNTTTNTLTHKIVTLTPPNLTSPSPHVRASASTLLATALPTLAHDANTLLPLSATLFPLISTRIFAFLPTSIPTSNTTSTFRTKAISTHHFLSSERGERREEPPPYELLTHLHTLTTLLEVSGDFLLSRTTASPAWWSQFQSLYFHSENQMWEERRLLGHTNKRGERWRVWDACVGVLVSVIRDVGVSEGAEGGVWGILGGWVGGGVGGETEGADDGRGKRGERKGKGWGGEGRGAKGREEREGVMDEARKREVRQVLGWLNADMLWLVEERARVAAGGDRMEKPSAGGEFVDLE